MRLELKCALHKYHVSTVFAGIDVCAVASRSAQRSHGCDQGWPQKLHQNFSVPCQTSLSSRDRNLRLEILFAGAQPVGHLHHTEMQSPNFSSACLHDGE